MAKRQKLADAVGPPSATILKVLFLHACKALSSQLERNLHLQDHKKKRRKSAHGSLGLSSGAKEQPSVLKRLQAVAAGAEKLWQEAVSARTPVSTDTVIDFICAISCCLPTMLIHPFAGCHRRRLAG